MARVSIAPLVCNNPHLDINAVLKHIPREGKVLYVGRLNVSVLVQLAKSRPFVEFHGFDNEWAVVEKVRRILVTYGLSNVTYVPSKFDDYCRTRTAIGFDVVLYIPIWQWQVSRSYNEAKSSRMVSVLNCYDLTPKGRTFIMAAALVPRCIAQQQADMDTLKTMNSWYHSNVSRSHFKREVFQELESYVTQQESVKYVLTCMGSIYRITTRQPYSVVRGFTSKMIQVGKVPYAWHMADTDYRLGYIMYPETYLQLLEELDMEIIEYTNRTPRRLLTFWSQILDVKITELPVMLRCLGGVIVAKKPI